MIEVPPVSIFRPFRLLAGALALTVAAAGCSRADGNETAPAANDKGPAAELRLGYFPNVTHAAALVGLGQGLFTKELGSTKLVPTKFNAGPEAVGALLGGSLDASFIGSGPAINAYAKSNGEAVRLIAGATSGGAQLVVKPTITKPADLVGKTVVTPQLGNTQDVSLKKWLAEQKLTGKVKVTNLENDRSVMVRVIDRGPAKPERREGVIIDLSRAAAKRLDFTDDGRARVRIEVVKMGKFREN